ncbi:MAG: substrate-binding domain-containing protein [Clostridiaceae bacterium]|nr:substrate-binding domain-containing protein [Clostridiaceae bacterium]
MSFIKRATIKDVAAAQGVSLSTVNKALYGKPGVSPQRRAEILAAADALGYHPNRAALSLARARIRIGVVIPSDWPSYHEPMKNGILRAFADLRDFFVTGDIRYYDAEHDAPRQVAALFSTLRTSGCDAVIFCPGERYPYVDALADAEGHHLPVAIVGDARPDAPCLFTVQPDIPACAALAANLLTLSTPPDAPLAVVGGFADLAPHTQKAAVFEQSVRRPVYRIFAMDKDDNAYEKVLACLGEVPDLAGIYISTSVGDGVCRAVIDSTRPIRVAATDLSPSLKAYLDSGVIDGIIYQNTYLQGALAVLTLVDYLTLRVLPSPVRSVSPKLFLRANCPASVEDAADELLLRG